MFFFNKAYVILVILWNIKKVENAINFYLYTYFWHILYKFSKNYFNYICHDILKVFGSIQTDFTVHLYPGLYTIASTNGSAGPCTGTTVVQAGGGGGGKWACRTGTPAAPMREQRVKPLKRTDTLVGCTGRRRAATLLFGTLCQHHTP